MTLILGLIVLAFCQYVQSRKQAKNIAAIQSQIVKMDHDAAEERAAAVNAQGALASCLMWADDHEKEFLRLNGTVNDKGIVHASMNVFEEARKRKDAEMQECRTSPLLEGYQQ